MCNMKKHTLLFSFSPYTWSRDSAVTCHADIYNTFIILVFNQSVVWRMNGASEYIYILKKEILIISKLYFTPLGSSSILWGGGELYGQIFKFAFFVWQVISEWQWQKNQYNIFLYKLLTVLILFLYFPKSYTITVHVYVDICHYCTFVNVL